MRKSVTHIEPSLQSAIPTICDDLAMIFSNQQETSLATDNLRYTTNEIVENCIDFMINKSSNAAVAGTKLGQLLSFKPELLAECQRVLQESIYHALPENARERMFPRLCTLMASISNGFFQQISLTHTRQHTIASECEYNLENKSIDSLNASSSQPDLLVEKRTRGLKDTDSQPVGANGRQEIIEQTLDEIKRRYQAMAEAVPVLIFIINRNDVVEYVNPYAKVIFDLSPEKIIGKKRATLFTDKTNKIQEHSLNNVWQEGKSIQVQESIQLLNGKRLYLDTILTPLFKTDKLQEVLGVSRDITREIEAEQKVEKQESKYKAIFNKIHNAILQINDGVVVDCNYMAQIYFGIPPEIILGASFSNLLGIDQHDHQREKQRLDERMQRCLGGEQQQFEIEFYRGDGEILFLEVHLARFSDDDRQILAVVRNITPYKKVLQALKTSEARFKDIVSRSLDGYYFIGRDLKVKSINKALEEITSFTMKEINAYLKIGVDDKRTKVLNKMIKTVMGGTPIPWQEMQIVDRDGKKRWIALNARRVYDGGDVVGIEGFVKNITTRKQAEIQLIESEMRYKTLFESTPYDVFGLTPGKKFIKVNHNFMKTWGVLEDKKLSSLRPASLAGLIRALCDKVAETKQFAGGNYFSKSNAKYYRIIIAPNIIAGGQIKSYTGLIIDVTESVNALQDKKKYAEALIKSTEEVQKQISREIHDSLGQMLFALQAELTAIKERCYTNNEDKNDIFEYAERLLTKAMREAGSICYRLHSRLLDDFGLKEATEDIIADIRKNNQLQVLFEWKIKNATLSPNVQTALFRIIQEAFANVLKHSRATKVNLVFSESEKNVAVSIKDNGCGFDFERVLNSKNRGFGLLNMKERVEIIDGRFQLETSPGQGVEILITLPKQ